MVNWDNYEEYMMLYADNELNAAEQEALLAFVAAHPELQRELQAYKATQLVPDADMVFANKETLLRKEEATKTIALGKWWMYAAAAAVLLFAVVIINQNDKTETFQPVAVTQPVAQPTPVTKDTVQELHSTPVNPVAIENKLASHQPPVRTITKPKEHKPVIVPAPQPKQEPYITKETPKKTELPRPTVTELPHNVAATQPKPEVVQEPAQQEEAPQVAHTEKKRKRLLGWLPINRENNEGLTALAGAVNEKLEKVKTLKNDLKDRDVTVKIGSKELFVVKL